MASIGSTLGGVVLLTGLTAGVTVVAGVMLAIFTVIVAFWTLAPRFSDKWAEELGENTDRKKAVDYRDAIVDETTAEPDTDVDTEEQESPEAEAAA